MNLRLTNAMMVTEHDSAICCLFTPMRTPLKWKTMKGLRQGKSPSLSWLSANPDQILPLVQHIHTESSQAALQTTGVLASIKVHKIKQSDECTHHAGFVIITFLGLHTLAHREGAGVLQCYLF